MNQAQKLGWLVLAITSLLGAAAYAEPAQGSNSAKIEQFKKHIDHIVVIYQENWSFDGLYGRFPGAEGLDAGPNLPAWKQVGRDGKPYQFLPPVFADGLFDPRFPGGLAVAPFDCSAYIHPDQKTGDLIHRFLHEQWQIDADPKTGVGRMDKFVAWTDAGALVMSYFDASNLPEGKLAKEFTICDHFFHSAFGGSFLNHIFFIAAAPPEWEDWNLLPKDKQNALLSDRNRMIDNTVIFDRGGNKPFAVNTVYSVNTPHPLDPCGKNTNILLPVLHMPTIGDRLSEKSISWKWYSGGWNNAAAGKADEEFQFHHQPFIYFNGYGENEAGRAKHLRDEQDLYTDIATGDLPAVSFVKFYGTENEHPGYSASSAGQKHTADLADMIRYSDAWPTTMIVIAYDENGGRWDHVPPPSRDEWGPGTRVPAIVISPWAKRRHVDHTPYDTLSILRLIETRFDLHVLTGRELAFGDMLETLDFAASPTK